MMRCLKMLFSKKKRIKVLKEEYSKDPSNIYIAVRFNLDKKIEYLSKENKWTSIFREASIMTFQEAFWLCNKFNYPSDSYICFGQRITREVPMIDVLKKCGALFVPVDVYLEEVQKMLQESLNNVA